jgi:hypothetical protein
MPGPYRPPNKEEENELRVLIGDESRDGPHDLGEEEANSLLDWLKKPEHRDVSVSAWWWNSNHDWEGKEGPTSILSIVYESDEIPVDHPIIAELDSRSPDFKLQDSPSKWGTNVIKNLEEKKLPFYERNKMMEEERAKNTVAKLAHAKDFINKPIIAARNALAVRRAVTQVAKKGKLSADEEAVIYGLISGHTGSVEQQTAKLEPTAAQPLEKGGRRTKKTIPRKRKTRRAKQSKSRKRGAQR